MRKDYSVKAESKIYSSNAIDEALLRCSSSSDTAVAYFYSAYNDHEKQSLEKMVRSLTLQLSLRGETDSQVLEELYKTCQYGQRQPSLDELTATLRLSFRSLRQHIDLLTPWMNATRSIIFWILFTFC